MRMSRDRKSQIPPRKTTGVGCEGSPKSDPQKGEPRNASRDPIWADRLQEFEQKLKSRYKPTAQDFWALMGVRVSDKLQRMRTNAQRLLEMVNSPTRRNSAERYAEINRAVVEALRNLQLLGSPPPDELIDLIAHQLGVSGRARKTPIDDVKWRKAVALVAVAPERSDRSVGKAISIDHKTVRAWRKKEDFQKAVHSEQETNRNLKVWEETNVRRGRKEVEDKPVTTKS